jgi:hypothetical protein
MASSATVPLALLVPPTRGLCQQNQSRLPLRRQRPGCTLANGKTTKVGFSSRSHERTQCFQKAGVLEKRGVPAPAKRRASGEFCLRGRVTTCPRDHAGREAKISD